MAKEGRLAPMLIELLNDKARLAAMRKGALTLSRPEAADAVADELLKIANSN
jgi:UDP-N-acetylglucosamine:LPS N-acetylglucosamine transferase